MLLEIYTFIKEIKSLDYSNIFKKLFLDNNFEWCDEKEEYLELSVWKSTYPSRFNKKR